MSMRGARAHTSAGERHPATCGPSVALRRVPSRAVYGPNPMGMVSIIGHRCRLGGGVLTRGGGGGGLREGARWVPRWGGANPRILIAQSGSDAHSSGEGEEMDDGDEGEYATYGALY